MNYVQNPHPEYTSKEERQELAHFLLRPISNNKRDIWLPIPRPEAAGWAPYSLTRFWFCNKQVIPCIYLELSTSLRGIKNMEEKNVNSDHKSQVRVQRKAEMLRSRTVPGSRVQYCSSRPPALQTLLSQSPPFYRHDNILPQASANSIPPGPAIH